ncbi:MAG: hypothetical protein IT340_22525 [Chloroflexi bacterium]|nr:hypothetical protein [Chloroflexota bacterium]
MITVDEAVGRIGAAAAPVLCLDTCALLDVLRDPRRDGFDGRHARAALELLARAEASPPTLTGVLAGQVVRELDEHIDRVRDETAGALRQLDGMLARVFGIMAAHGLIAESARPDLSALAFPAVARAAVDRIVAVAHAVHEVDDCIRRASARVVSARAPATPTKQSYKDCLIIETYLEVVRRLRGIGFAEPAVFLTTNARDYTDSVRGHLHPDLISDFQAAGLAFAPNLSAAGFELRRREAIASPP